MAPAAAIELPMDKNAPIGVAGQLLPSRHRDARGRGITAGQSADPQRIHLGGDPGHHPTARTEITGPKRSDSGHEEEENQRQGQGSQEQPGAAQQQGGQRHHTTQLQQPRQSDCHRQQLKNAGQQPLHLGGQQPGRHQLKQSHQAELSGRSGLPTFEPCTQHQGPGEPAQGG